MFLGTVYIIHAGLKIGDPMRIFWRVTLLGVWLGGKVTVEG